MPVNIGIGDRLVATMCDPIWYASSRKAVRLVATDILHFLTYLCCTQVPAAKSRLQSGDVFILDMGVKVFQWNGSEASVFEKHKVRRIVNPT